MQAATWRGAFSFNRPLPFYDWLDEQVKVAFVVNLDVFESVCSCGNRVDVFVGQ